MCRVLGSCFSGVQVLKRSCQDGRGIGTTSALLKKDYTFSPPELHKQLNGRKGHVRWGVDCEANIDLGNLKGTSHVLMEMSKFLLP